MGEALKEVDDQTLWAVGRGYRGRGIVFKKGDIAKVVEWSSPTSELEADGYVGAAIKVRNLRTGETSYQVAAAIMGPNGLDGTELLLGDRWRLGDCGCVGVIGSLERDDHGMIPLAAEIPCSRWSFHAYLCPWLDGASLLERRAEPARTQARFTNCSVRLTVNGQELKPFSMKYDDRDPDEALEIMTADLLRRASERARAVVQETRRLLEDAFPKPASHAQLDRLAGLTPPPVRLRREVSPTGRGSWVDYELLAADADPFESYPHRRVLQDGLPIDEHGVVVDPPRLPCSLSPEAGVGHGPGVVRAVGRGERLVICDACFLTLEETAFVEMCAIDVARPGFLPQAPEPRRSLACTPTAWGGIFDPKAP